MKSLLLILFTIIPLCACAQKYSARRNQDAAALRAQAHARDSLMQTLQITAAGAYEKEEMVYIDSVPAKVLFTRAMETPNDLPVTKVELDYSNKESSTVIPLQRPHQMNDMVSMVLFYMPKDFQELYELRLPPGGTACNLITRRLLCKQCPQGPRCSGRPRLRTQS